MPGIRYYPRWIYMIVNPEIKKEAMDNYDSMAYDMFGNSIDYRLRWSF